MIKVLGALLLLSSLYACSGSKTETIDIPKPAKFTAMCTQEVKSCPDGSMVARDPRNNCAFAACKIPTLPTAPVRACTREAKVCPNGASVGRNPALNCEFDPCPDIATKMCTMEAKLCPDGSSVSRNAANNCAFDPCPGAKQ